MSTDYTPIGPMPAEILNGNVDSTSKQLARDVRSKAYGKDVREGMARMAEWHSVRSSEITDSAIRMESITTAMENRFSDFNVLSEYPCEMGVVGLSGTLNATAHGIRTTDYIKLFKGTRIRLTNYTNHRFRVARYTLSNKDFIQNRMDLSKDYYITEDCYVKISVTLLNTSGTITNIKGAADLCTIDHKLVSGKIDFSNENETITINYGPNEQPTSIVTSSPKGDIASFIEYTDGKVSSIVEQLGPLTSTFSFSYEGDRIKTITKTGGNSQ